jgi:hypothetical protein
VSATVARGQRADRRPGADRHSLTGVGRRLLARLGDIVDGGQLGPSRDADWRASFSPRVR